MTTTTLALGYIIGFNIDNESLTEGDFRNAFDETIGRTLDAKPRTLNDEIAKLLADIDITMPAHKGIAVKTGSGMLMGSYHIKEAKPLHEVISSIEEDLAHAPIEHGLVTISVYTEEDKNPTHFFIMAPEAHELQEVSAAEFNRIELQTMGYEVNEK